MTVDHLKHLHSKAYNYHDPHSLSMDYRVIGFRECAAEVARYMVTAEGMDIQDPLRLRMMSHLQCYSAQREAACKLQQSAGSASWNLQASGLNSQYNTNTGSIGPMSLQHTQSDTNLAMSMSSHMPHVAAPHCSSTLTTVSCHDPRSTLSQNNNNEMTNLNLRLPTTGGSVTPQMSGTVSSTNISPHVPLLPTLPHGAGQVNTQLPGYSMPMLSPNGTHSNYSMANSMSSISQQHAANTAKPYRPWGGPEVAY
ncbi:unnamed protein product [Owenia fusiformis]|nr:unnamed protein product [Owenia fusiformis]